MNVKVVEQHEVDSYENCTQTQSSSWSQMRIQKTHHNAQLSKKENKVVKLKLLPKSNQELLIQRSRHQDRQLAEFHQRTRWFPLQIWYRKRKIFKEQHLKMRKIKNRNQDLHLDEKLWLIFKKVMPKTMSFSNHRKVLDQTFNM